MSVKISEKQAQELFSAAHDLCALFARDVCRLMIECDGDFDLKPYFDSFPNRYAQALDSIVYQISEGEMEAAEHEASQRAKYERAMAEMQAPNPTGD